MSLLRISRDVSTLWLHVDTQLPIQNRLAGFTFSRGSDFDAALLEQHIKEMLYKRMQKIREEAYLEGHKHGRAKEGKRNWFSGELP